LPAGSNVAKRIAGIGGTVGHAPKAIPSSGISDSRKLPRTKSANVSTTATPHNTGMAGLSDFSRSNKKSQIVLDRGAVVLQGRSQDLNYRWLFLCSQEREQFGPSLFEYPLLFC
jgi:hypothetical protein